VNKNKSADPVDKTFEDGLDPNRWRALFVIAFAALMVVLDASIVNIALPAAQKALHISDVNRQWVVTAYSLSFGALLLLGGRLADFIGRKRIFIIGLAGFALASGLGGLSQNQGELFAARAVQGAFGALLAPAALSLINVTFRIPKERAKAFGVYGAVSGGGAAIGLIVGGTLTEYANWRWCLGVNVFFAIFAIALAIPFIHESRAHGDRSYDIPGTILATIGLVSLVYGFSQAGSYGWHSSKSWSYFVVAAILLISFVWWQQKAKTPLLPLRVVLETNRGGTYLSSFLVGVGLFAIFLFLSIYFQAYLHYSALKSGFAFLPFSGGIIVFAGVSAQLLPKVGPRPLIAGGLVAASLGLLWFSRLSINSNYWRDIFPAMILTACSLALYFIPSASTGLHDAGEHDAGVASAVLNTSQQIGGSLGAALLNTVSVSVATHFYLAHSKLPNAQAVAAVHGFDRAFIAGAGFLLVAALFAAKMIKVGKDSLTEHEGVAII
jgi:EmrB/QacA subfamily drug resistance transporter